MRREGLTPYGVEVCKKLIDKRMTHAELAKQIGCSRPYLSDILNGRRNDLKYSKVINQVLGIPDKENMKESEN